MTPEKSMMIAFLRQDPVRCTIAVNNRNIKQIKNFKYLSCKISYDNETDTQQKLAKFAQILEIL